MKTVIEFAYTGSISWKKIDNLPNFIRDADFLGIDDIKEEGIKILVSYLEPLEAVKAYHLSDICSNILLKEESYKVIFQNFGTVAETDDFLTLNIDSIKDILSSSYCIFPTEKIFRGVLKWIVKDIEVRKSHLKDIFELIECGRAHLDMILRISTDEKLLTESEQHK